MWKCIWVGLLILILAGCSAAGAAPPAAMTPIAAATAASSGAGPATQAAAATPGPAGGATRPQQVPQRAPQQAPPQAPIVATAASALATLVAPSGLPAFSHVFVIVMENKEATQVVGSQNAPYLNQLAAGYGRAANYYGASHPSLPNYLALTGGDTFGVTSDCTGCFQPADNLAAQLEKAGRSWKAYMESMPQPCYLDAAAPDYAQRHNPFMYYDNIRNNPALCRKVVPLTQLSSDLQSGQVPDFVWITPNLCHDMHNCSVATGDGWLQQWVPQILDSPAWQDGGVLFIVFDEGMSNAGCCKYAAGGKVDALVVSPLARQGFVSQTAYDHYSVLRTIETAWGLPLLGKAGCDCTATMKDFFAR